MRLSLRPGPIHPPASWLQLRLGVPREFMSKETCFAGGRRKSQIEIYLFIYLSCPKRELHDLRKSRNRKQPPGLGAFVALALPGGAGGVGVNAEGEVVHGVYGGVVPVPQDGEGVHLWRRGNES